MATTQELLIEGWRRLSRLKGAEAALEARILLRRTLGFTELEILAYPEREVPAAGRARFLKAVDARTGRKPLAYVLGEKEFWSIPFTVTPAVLIPRPETELLVETVLALAGDGDTTIAEIGTGSGAVAVALARELPSARLIATDISRRALAVARANAARHGAVRIEFLAGNLFAPLTRAALRGALDFLVSNPPYVAEREWPRLAPEVRDFEPKPALVPGPTGLETIRRLIAGAPEFLKPGGFLVFEFGRGQARSVRGLLKKPWADVVLRPDLRGIPRVAAARLTSRLY
jgi:release factor glutamine methyltransferase